MAKTGGGEEEESGGSGVVPEHTVDAVKRSLANMEELQFHLQQFLSLAEPEVLAELQPLQRAQALFLLSKASSLLVAVRLRCSGVQPEDHPVKTELERINLYQEKLERSMALSKAPLRPSTTLNYKAATRFIEHSLPDLTSEQKRCMRDISRGETVSRRDSWSGQKKRKFPKEKQSVRASAHEFLEKATRELLGANKGDMKGPLKIDSSDGED